MDVYSAIRISAFRAVQEEDREYALRKMMRWYSKTFHTPLPQVEEIPLEDIAQAYFEERYAEMDDRQLEQELAELKKTPEEVYQQMLKEEADEAEMFQMARMVAEEAKRSRAAVKQKDGTIAPVQHAATRLPTMVPEADLPKALPVPPPDLTMSFTTDAALEAEIAAFEERGNKKK